MDGAWVHEQNLSKRYFECQVISVMRTVEMIPFDYRDWVNEWTTKDGQYWARYRHEGGRLIFESSWLVKYGG